MKKIIIATAIALSAVSAWSEEHQSAGSYELGVAAGKDYGTHENLTALSLGVPIGSSGFKGVLEYAKGRHGEAGADVTSLKVAKEIFSVGHAEFGVAGGYAHSAALEESGNGWVVGAEATYPLTKKVSAKLEASRFYGVGSISHVKANVVQAGLVYKFD